MQVEQVRLVGHCPSAQASLLSFHAVVGILYLTTLKLQVPDDEFFVLEPALLAARRQLAVRPESQAASATKTRKLPASIGSDKKPCAVLPSPAVGDSRKRKLPPSFAEQQKQTTPAAPAALQYKVPEFS